MATGEPYGIDAFKFRDISQMVATSVSVLTTITEVLPANEGRNWVYLQNLSDTSMWIGFCESAANCCGIGKGVRLEKHGTGNNNSFEFGRGIGLPQIMSNVYAVSGTSGSKLNLLYHNET